MMKNYKQFNEGINDYLKGPTKEEVLRDLIKKNRNNPNALLDVSCKYDLPKGVEKALSLGANFPQRDGKYDNALHNLIEANCLEVIPVLMKHGIIFTEIPPLEVLEQLYDTYKECVLSILDTAPSDVAMIRSLELDCLEGVKSALKRGADIHNINEYPLRYACDQNQYEIAKYLLENGANVHAKTEYCLRYVIMSENIEIARLLIEHGAIVQYQMIKKVKEEGNKELLDLLLKNYKKTNESVLDNLKGPSDEELLKKYDGWKLINIFYDASRLGWLNGIKYAIEKDNGLKKYIDVILRKASDKGYLEIVKYCLDNGADIHTWTDASLCSAAESGHYDVVKYLLDNGADVYSKRSYEDEEGAESYNAYELALMNNHDEVAKLIKTYMKK